MSNHYLTPVACQSEAMLHRCSLSAEDPHLVAHQLAQLISGVVSPLDACPGGFVAWSNDGLGTSLEVLPRGIEVTPDARGPAQFERNYFSQHLTSTRVTLSVACSPNAIEELAERNEWPIRYSDRGGYEVIELWVEGHTLLELMTSRMTSGYLESLGSPRIAGSGTAVRRLEFSVEAQVVPEEAWQAWVDPELLCEWWELQEAHVDLRIGGAYELIFLPEGSEGLRGSEGCRILDYVPGRMLAFTFNSPSHLDMGRDHTWVTVDFAPSETGTVVTVNHCGFLSDDRWIECREFFRQAWRRTLRRFESYWAGSAPSSVSEQSVDLRGMPAPAID